MRSNLIHIWKVVAVLVPVLVALALQSGVSFAACGFTRSGNMITVAYGTCSVTQLPSSCTHSKSSYSVGDTISCPVAATATSTATSASQSATPITYRDEDVLIPVDKKGTPLPTSTPTRATLYEQGNTPTPTPTPTLTFSQRVNRTMKWLDTPMDPMPFMSPGN